MIKRVNNIDFDIDIDSIYANRNNSSGHADQDAEDEDLEVGERLLQLCRQALCLCQEGFND